MEKVLRELFSAHFFGRPYRLNGTKIHLHTALKTLQLFFVLYGSVVPGCSAGVPCNVQLFRRCSGVSRCSADVSYSVVPCSGVPGFIACRESPISRNIQKIFRASFFHFSSLKSYFLK